VQELIRRRLLGDEVKWTTMGQSFGGFCTLTYLSIAPHGLEASLITGGLSPVVPGCSADSVYSKLFKRVRTQNTKFYQRFPHDQARVRSVVQAITAAGGSVPLPSGGRLTAQGLQALGINLGFAGGMESLHFLFEIALDSRGGLSHAFLRQYENMMSIDTNPIYAILHESICALFLQHTLRRDTQTHARAPSADTHAAWCTQTARAPPPSGLRGARCRRRGRTSMRRRRRRRISLCCSRAR